MSNRNKRHLLWSGNEQLALGYLYLDLDLALDLDLSFACTECKPRAAPADLTTLYYTTAGTLLHYFVQRALAGYLHLIWPLLYSSGHAAVLYGYFTTVISLLRGRTVCHRS